MYYDGNDTEGHVQSLGMTRAQYIEFVQEIDRELEYIRVEARERLGDVIWHDPAYGKRLEMVLHQLDELHKVTP